MFHVLHGIYTNIMSTQPNEQNPTIISPLDLHNAFNMESRQHILQHFASACHCPIVLTHENSNAWHGWDILYKHIRAHYGKTILFKGTQQGDLLWTLTLAELHVRVLTSFINFLKALTKFNEALTKPYHGLIEMLLQIDFRYYSKWLYNKKTLKSEYRFKNFIYLFLPPNFQYKKWTSA